MSFRRRGRSFGSKRRRTMRVMRQKIGRRI